MSYKRINKECNFEMFHSSQFQQSSIMKQTVPQNGVLNKE